MRTTRNFLCLLPTLLLFALVMPAQAQLDNGINYQAVVRDAQGDPLPNSAVTLLFQVRQGSIGGSIVFQDTHYTTTNDLGLVTAVIGKGTTTIGDLAAMDYVNNSYFLQVFVNGSGIPQQRLEAVPMAYKATNMDLSDLKDVAALTPVSGQVLLWTGSNWEPGTVAGGSGLWTSSGSSIHYTGGPVGVGTSAPQHRLHVHESQAGTPTTAQYTNSSTGSTSTDGFHLRVDPDGSAHLRQRESSSLSLWTSDQQRMTVLNNGRVGINTTTMIGSADLVVRSLNSSGYGGMYIESPSGTAGLPFYGYATNGQARAWHYFDEASDQWRLSNGLDWLAVDNSGRMGLGTTAMESSAILHLNSTVRGFLLPRMTTAQRTAIANPAEALLVYDTNLSKTMQYRSGAWQDLATGSGSSQWSDDSFGISYTAGRVGIGIGSSPIARLNLSSAGDPIALTAANNYTGNLNTYGVFASVGSSGTGTRYGLRGSVSAPGGSSASAYGVYGNASASSSSSDVYGVYGLASATAGGTGYGVYGRANGSGNVGVYGFAPDAGGIAVHGEAGDQTGLAGRFNGLVLVEDDLRVSDNLRLKAIAENGSPRFEMFTDFGQSTVRIVAERTAGSGAGVYLKNSDGSPSVTLLSNFNGDRGRVITDELEIRGGADLAEHFAVTVPEDMELLPGMLVSIASDGSGDLVATTTPYDHRVAGVVSGANGVQPGLTLRQEGAIGDGDVPVALTGRVYVLADATDAPIAPGDALTSAARPGHAMKASERERAHGAVIGKAMTSLAEGRGMVLVLVNLQ